jgi:hypothetical protein
MKIRCNFVSTNKGTDLFKLQKIKIMKTLATEKMNETTFNLAVQTYAELSNRSIEEVVTEIQNGNKTLVENIIKLMFLAA